MTTCLFSGSLWNCLFMLDILPFHYDVSGYKLYSSYHALNVLFQPQKFFLFFFLFQSWTFSAIISLTVSLQFPLFYTFGTFIKTNLEPFHLTIISPIHFPLPSLYLCTLFWLNFKNYHIFSVIRSSLEFLSIEFFNPVAVFFISKIANWSFGYSFDLNL